MRKGIIIAVLLLSPAAAFAAVDSSHPIQQDIGKVSPQVEQFLSPAFSMIDNLRLWFAGELQMGVDWGKSQTGTAPPVVTDIQNPPQNVTQAENVGLSSLWYVLGLVALYGSTILLFVVSTALIFYPVFLLVCLYLIWKIISFFR